MSKIEFSANDINRTGTINMGVASGRTVLWQSSSAGPVVTLLLLNDNTEKR